MIVGGVQRWIPVVVVAVAALPVGIVAARLLARRRVRMGVAETQARRTAWAEVGLVVTTLPWLWMILTPLPGDGSVRLVPLVDLAELVRGRPDVAFVQVVGNLLVFAGYGFNAAIRWRISVLGVVATAALASVTVETAQFVLDLGRVTSIDDVLLNATGAGLAALLAKRLAKRVEQRAPFVGRTNPDGSVP